MNEPNQCIVHIRQRRNGQRREQSERCAAGIAAAAAALLCDASLPALSRRMMTSGSVVLFVAV